MSVPDRSRNWCFTLNNYTEDDENEVFGISWDRGVKYIVAGREVGDSGTKHLQGYLCFKESKALRQVTQYFDGRGHWEIARGNHEQASDYCKKEEDFFEWGVRPMDKHEKGVRGAGAGIERWDLALAAAREGRFEDVPSDIFARYRSTILTIRRDEQSKNVTTILDGELEHEWWYGSAGTGKTSRAVREFPDAFTKDPKERWWDGYEYQDVVIIDDFDKYQVSMAGDIKRWLDRYAFQAPVKGGYMRIRPRKVIITSNYHFKEIWDDAVTQACIARRVKVVKFCGEVGEVNLSPLADTFRPLETNK